METRTVQRQRPNALILSTACIALALSITDNASGSPQTVSLSGTGTAPLVSLSPTSLAFGSQPVGTRSSTAYTVKLSNTGNGTLSITSLALTGTNASDFAQIGRASCRERVLTGV